MSRLQSLYKLAKETLSERDYVKINFLLSMQHGFDNIISTLSDNGFEKLKRFDTDKYQLSYKGKVLNNAYLEGDYQGMKVMFGEPPEEKHQVPWDSHFTPSALYELEEKEKEDREYRED